MRRAESRRNGIRFCAIQLSIVRCETPTAKANSCFERKCLPNACLLALVSTSFPPAHDLEGSESTAIDGLFASLFMRCRGTPALIRHAIVSRLRFRCRVNRPMRDLSVFSGIERSSWRRNVLRHRLCRSGLCRFGLAWVNNIEALRDLLSQRSVAPLCV
jgi:hypothetical protein